ncbi:hypothetical protein CRENBAI_000374 [Crenichthys baileyi]|uniref:Uncharacterized protein n=1 Tax=Crenichthys baileyi TaxID=28760 RepID=A0AAV9SFS2_9TELE
MILQKLAGEEAHAHSPRGCDPDVSSNKKLLAANIGHSHKEASPLCPFGRRSRSHTKRSKQRRPGSPGKAERSIRMSGRGKTGRKARAKTKIQSSCTGLEILELAGNTAHNNKKTHTITCSWLSTTMRTSTSCWMESPSLSCSPMKLLVNSPTTVLLRATHL